MNTIKEFQGEYRFLSNFWKCYIDYKGFTFTSSEALYMALKSGKDEDLEYFSQLNPGEAKRAGKRVKLRDDWEKVKVDIMREVVKLKFDQNPYLKRKLLATKGMILEEGNTWKDTFWGICNGEGQNWLGKILMEYRDSN